MTLDAMKDHYQTRAREYASLKASAEGSAVRWTWATGHLGIRKPFYYEISKRSPGRNLKEEPQDKSETWHIGWDAQNRVVVQRHYTSLKDRFYEHFFFYKPDEIESVLFDYAPEKALINCEIFEFVSQKIQRRLMWAQKGAQEAHYRYQGSQITEISEVYYDLNTQLSDQDTFGVFYDSLGQLEAIKDQHQRVYYQKKTPGTDWKTLARLFLEKAVHLVLKTLEAQAPKEPLYSLGLLYGSEDPFPPELGIGLASDRDQFLKDYPADAGDYLWNPAEYPRDLINLSGLDPQLDKICQALNQEISESGKESLGQKLLLELAKALKTQLPQTALKFTDDFLVYPVDYELTDLKSNLKKLYGPDRVKDLKTRGLL